MSLTVPAGSLEFWSERLARWQWACYFLVFWLAFVVTVIGWSSYLIAVLDR